MKTIILLTMFLMVSCGKKDSGSSNPYLFEVTNFNKQWNFYTGTGDGKFTFESIDFSDLNNVMVTNMRFNGVTANCTYSATSDKYNDFAGALTFVYLTGDMTVCSPMIGSWHFEAINDTRMGVEYLKLLGLEFR